MTLLRKALDAAHRGRVFDDSNLTADSQTALSGIIDPFSVLQDMVTLLRKAQRDLWV